MTNATLIQSKVDYGYGKVATILGENCVQYRPADYANAVTSTAEIGTCMARFDPSNNLAAIKPQLYAHPVWIVAIDRSTTGVKVGDYLIANSGTYFMLAEQPLLPSACVMCNRTLTVYRPAANVPSATHYFGNVSDHGDGQQIMVGFPASLLSGTKGEGDPDQTPGSPRQPWCAILMPVFPGVLIETADLIIDDLDRRWTVSSVEVSDLGYKLSAAFSGA